MKRILSLFASALIALVSCSDNSSVEPIIAETPSNFTCYAVYPGADGVVDTKAPKGYRPFYISHYGRHGSRYVNMAEMLKEPISVLENASRKDLLTDEGKALFQELRFQDSLATGHIGLLTPRGKRELESIGNRIALRYPGVFKGRDSVFCIMSTYQRCMLSMVCYNDQLKSNYPSLKFGYDMGGNIQTIINNGEGIQAVTSENQSSINSHFEECFDFDDFAVRLFKNPSAYPENPLYFVRYIYLIGSDQPCLGYDESRLFRFFTSEQLRAAWEDYNMHLYLNHCHSASTGKLRQSMQASLVDDFITKADAAIEGNDRAMDVRFGHDGALLSLCSFMGIEGYDKCVGADRANSVWSSDRMMPMATNLHLVFYQAKEQPVLVKVLFNEKETAVPELGVGPYYQWRVLKSYLQTRMKDFLAEANSK